MDDKEIIDLFLTRNERAIKETDNRYGAFSRNLSYRILNSHEDAEECVNDAYLKLWDSIPPTEPESLKAYLGRIVRNLSLNRLRWKTEQKRNCDAEVLLSEIADCVPSNEDVEGAFDQRLISELITKWLSGEKEVNRQIFVRRYWYGSTYEELAKHYRLSEKKLMDRLYHMRRRLKDYLEKEGISV
ncbi:MAG: sigma-70 family RNA polymerase sigma factor [Eubacterium sp.]|nr:sigma-70 family RNA polymerase sigma factor [Eubacterium sp.]